MARGWVGRSKGERELETHIEGTWGPSRRERFMRRLSIVMVLVMMMAMALFVVGVSMQTAVEERYAVLYSAPAEMYIGQLDISEEGLKDLRQNTQMTLYLDIPEWDVHIVRELDYEERDANGDRLDFLVMDPINGQVVKDKSRERVEITLRVEIVTPHPEVAKLKILGNSNMINGQLRVHPEEPLLELEETTNLVRVRKETTLEVRNKPVRDDVEYWFLNFSRSRLT